eukprot:1118202-Prorocentrum_lima.AAC.1
MGGPGNPLGSPMSSGTNPCPCWSRGRQRVRESSLSSKRHTSGHVWPRVARSSSSRHCGHPMHARG